MIHAADVEVNARRRRALAWCRRTRAFSTRTADHGLPIGNLSSQFFANVYLDVLDQYVKHRAARAALHPLRR